MTAISRPQLPAQAMVFIQTAQSIATLRYQQRSSGAAVEAMVDILERALFEIVPHLGTVGPDILSQTVIANCPAVLEEIFRLYPSAKHAFPAIGSTQMQEMTLHLHLHPEVEAAIVLGRKGAIFSLDTEGRNYVETVLSSDCPRRLNFFLSIWEQRSFYEEDMHKILLRAGPKVSERLAQVFEANNDDLIPLIMGDFGEDLLLKEIACLLACGVIVDEHLMTHELERFGATDLLALIAKQHSNHGRIDLKRMQPSLAKVIATPLDGTFYGLSAPDTHLAKDARKVLPA